MADLFVVEGTASLEDRRTARSLRDSRRPVKKAKKELKKRESDESKEDKEGSDQEATEEEEEKEAEGEGEEGDEEEEVIEETEPFDWEGDEDYMEGHENGMRNIFIRGDEVDTGLSTDLATLHFVIQNGALYPLNNIIVDLIILFAFILFIFYLL